MSPRRKKPDPEKVREEILAAARAQVSEGGPEGLSLRGVARAVGYSPAGLYEYFDSRDAILEALARRASASLTRAFIEGRGKAPDEPPLVALGLAYLRFSRENREDFALLFQRLRSTRRGLEAPVGTDSSYALLRAAVEEAREAGTLDGAADPDAVAYAFWSLAHGMATLQAGHLQGFDADFEAADRAALRALLAGFSA
ncbi:MAG: TetR/AcrR family transcriptional regulator [Deltaproteobacteria bacterium]|nr:TetR/AcrR family transcriptional regulator [Deltaproteobacteria bacterium]